MSDPIVQRSDHGPVAVLTLNRPERRNALSMALMFSLDDHLERIALEPKVRAVVLTGADPVFSAGMDLKEAAARGEGPESEHHAVATLQEFADLLQRLHTLPKPTIAALNGDALAGGAGLVVACDLAIASEHARIGYPEVLRGLVPSVVMHDLTRCIGERRTRQLLLTGDLITASVAHQWGLINQVTSSNKLMDEAIRIGESFIQCAPIALATIKRLIDETEARPSSLRGAAAISAAVRVAEEADEGVKAFLEKRPPAWAVTG